MSPGAEKGFPVASIGRAGAARMVINTHTPLEISALVPMGG